MKLGSSEFRAWAYNILPAFLHEADSLVDAIVRPRTIVRAVFDLGRAYERRISAADAAQQCADWRKDNL